MKTPKKIALTSLIAAFAFFATGICSFPMAAGAASHPDMHGMVHQQSNDDTDYDSQVDASCSTCETSQNTLNSCSLSCGNSVSKTTAVKKSSGSDEILPMLSQGSVDPLSLLAIDTPSNLYSPPPDLSSATEVLLSVAKKE